MALDTAQVNTRAISETLMIRFISEDVDLSGPNAMELIGQRVDEYRAAIAGAVPCHTKGITNLTYLQRRNRRMERTEVGLPIFE